MQSRSPFGGVGDRLLSAEVTENIDPGCTALSALSSLLRHRARTASERESVGICRCLLFHNSGSQAGEVSLTCRVDPNAIRRRLSPNHQKAGLDPETVKPLRKK